MALKAGRYGVTKEQLRKIDSGGTTVVANPEGAATADLTKLQVGETVYGVDGDTSDCYKTTDDTESAIVDADYIPFLDSSAASGEGASKKSTWSNFKAKLKAYFDDLYLTARYLETTTKTTSGDVDTFTLTDSSITTDTVVLAVACSNPMKNYTSITISTGSVVVTYSSADSISKVGFLLRG